ncbi:MAG: hypothetical protein Fur0019_19370 [Tibeticola sp.]
MEASGRHCHTERKPVCDGRAISSLSCAAAGLGWAWAEGVRFFVALSRFVGYFVILLAMNHSAFLSGFMRGLGFGAFEPHSARHARLLQAVEAARAPMPARSDLDALRGDWIRIGDDFRGAAQKLEGEITRSR